MGRRRPAWRHGVAVAVSVGGHLALLLLARGQERAPRQAPIELEVVHLPPAEVAAPAAHEPAEDAPASPEPARARRSDGDPPARGREAAPPPRARAEAPAAAPEPGTRIPATPPAEPGPAPPPPRRLELLPDRYDLAAAAQPIEAGPAGGSDGAPPPPSPGHRLEALLADDRAAERALQRVDTYWSEMRRHLERGWDVDAGLLRDGPRRGLGLGLDPKEAWDGWRRQAERYAATGNPYGDGPFDPGSPTLADYARPLETPDLGTIYGDMAEDGAYRKHRTALVLVVQDRSGRVIDVGLQRPSGNKAFDELALAKARALAQLDLGMPPDGSKSLWSFDATLITTPPLPIAGCAVDAYFIPQHCFYPLSQRVKDAVRLVGVWGPDETPGIR